jgi:AcrR family transcriptional regulator
MAYVKASVRSEQLVRAARQVLIRDGVGGTTLRAIAREASVPLGTLHYVFPSKELLLKAVIEDSMEEISGVLEAAAALDAGLEHAIRQGVASYWTQLVVGDPRLQLMQHELLIYALRTPGLENLGRWQVERYSRIVAAWCQGAAMNAGESCAVPFDTLARIIVASMIGIVLQYIGDPDDARSRQDLQVVIDMVVGLADPRPARSKRALRS